MRDMLSYANRELAKKAGKSVAMHAAIHFQPSPYTPAAMSFFGLALGYVIMGGETLFCYPPRTPAGTRAMGMWAFYGSGVVQSISATILFVGLTWFGVFKSNPANYVLALAFVVQAAHWLAMGATRMRGADSDLEAWMGLPLIALAALAARVLFSAHETWMAIGFVILGVVYAADSMRGFHLFPGAQRVQGAVQFLAGWYMIYLSYSLVMSITQ